MVGELRKVLKQLHYPFEVMLVCARWYAAFPLSLRYLEELMQERGVFVDHSTVHCWSLKILPILALIFRCRKRCVGSSWRMDETYIKLAGQWKYLYRAVDKLGDTVNLLLSAKRDLAAARRYLECAINLHGLPEHRSSSIEVSQQYRGARPPSREENHRSHDGLQIILECAETDRRHRDHAHGQEGAVALPR